MEVCARGDAAAFERLDAQGRALILDFNVFVLFNIYNLAVTDDHNPRFQDKLLLGQVQYARLIWLVTLDCYGPLHLIDVVRYT